MPSNSPKLFTLADRPAFGTGAAKSFESRRRRASPRTDAGCPADLSPPTQDVERAKGGLSLVCWL